MIHLAGLPMFYSSTILNLSQACLLYIATNAPPHRQPQIPYPGQAPPSASVVDRTLLNVKSTQELENTITATATVPTRPGQVPKAASQAAPQPKEEVINAAPQYKEEVGDIANDNSPDICLSHLPETEEVGGTAGPFAGPW